MTILNSTQWWTFKTFTAQFRIVLPATMAPKVQRIRISHLPQHLINTKAKSPKGFKGRHLTIIPEFVFCRWKWVGETLCNIKTKKPTTYMICTSHRVLSHQGCPIMTGWGVWNSECGWCRNFGGQKGSGNFVVYTHCGWRLASLQAPLGWWGSSGAYNCLTFP